MRRLTRVLVRLYPATWRERYGEEFQTLIEDSTPGWSGAFDLAKGAIKMQMSSFPKLALILSLTGLVAGFGASWLMTPMYISQAQVQLHSANAERIIQLEKQVLSRTSLSTIIQDPRLDLYKSERAHVPFEDVIERMRMRDIQIRIARQDGKNNLPLVIRFIYPDPVRARDTLQVLVTRFNAAAGENLGVLDPPSLPARSARPNRAIFAAFGFGAGFVLAMIIAVFRRTPPPVPFPAQTA